MPIMESSCLRSQGGLECSPGWGGSVRRVLTGPGRVTAASCPAPRLGSVLKGFLGGRMHVRAGAMDLLCSGIKGWVGVGNSSMAGITVTASPILSLH